MKIKSSPEKFKVVELLKEKPQKEGPYNLYKLTKRGLETLPLIKKLSKESGVPLRVVSYGGLKDKNAYTVQFLTTPKDFPLKEKKGRNFQLKQLGYAKKPAKELIEGNRFEIAVEGAAGVPKKRLELLERLGFPNYYGEQRFNSVRDGKCFFHFVNEPELAVKHLFKGAGWENSRERKGKRLFEKGDYEGAAALLKGWRKRVALHLAKEKNDWEGAFRMIPEEELQFQANLLQSLLFNLKLKNLIEELQLPCLKFKYRAGYMLFPKEPAELPPKLPAFSPENAKEYEKELKELQIEPASLTKFSQFFHKFYRPTTVKPRGFSLKEKRGELLFKFSLPSGSYATVPLRFLLSAV